MMIDSIDPAVATKAIEAMRARTANMSRFLAGLTSCTLRLCEVAHVGASARVCGQSMRRSVSRWGGAPAACKFKHTKKIVCDYNNARHCTQERHHLFTSVS